LFTVVRSLTASGLELVKDKLVLLSGEFRTADTLYSGKGSLAYIDDCRSAIKLINTNQKYYGFVPEAVQ